jgi:nucleoside-diphosphate-sugar epimerase
MASHSDNGSPKVLVTGLTGFTGRYVRAELERAGYCVVGLSSNDPASFISLLDVEAVRDSVLRIQPHAVIHLAAIAFVAHGDVETVYRTNIVGTRNLLAALAELPTPPLSLLASSAHVYGNDDSGQPIDEQVASHPTNDYAVSKLAMEYMAQTWSARLPITIVRPFNYTGVGQQGNFLIPKIVDHFRRGDRHIELGNIDVGREFMDVRAVAWSYRRLLEIGEAGALLNVCTGVSYTLTDVLAMMGEIAGYEINVSVNPAFVRANEVRRLTGDNAQLRARIGDLPSYALADTLRWMYSV